MIYDHLDISNVSKPGLRYYSTIKDHPVAANYDTDITRTKIFVKDQNIVDQRIPARFRSSYGSRIANPFFCEILVVDRIIVDQRIPTRFRSSYGSRIANPFYVRSSYGSRIANPFFCEILVEDQIIVENESYPNV